MIVEGEGETGSQSQHVAGMFVLYKIVTIDMLVLDVSKSMFLQKSVTNSVFVCYRSVTTACLCVTGECDKQCVCMLQESVTNSVFVCYRRV